ncbi:MAG: hypothetical protein ACI81W_001493, partial [Saprospiraceae bacterium]
MRRILTIVSVLLCTLFNVYAQNCDPNSPPNLPAAGCACAFPDCSFGLNGFAATLGTLNTVQPFPGCGGNVLNNDDWIAFIAGSTTISITINIANCQSMGGNVGVQAGFYANCTEPVNNTDEGTSSNPLSLQCGCTTQPINLIYNSFIIGQTYYIVIDGCGGDICDYDIVVNSGSTMVDPPGPLGAITGPTTVCPGYTATYTVDPVSGINDYNWLVTGGTIVSENANTVTITWGAGGNVSAFGENACYFTNIVDLNVIVQALPDLTAEGDYCDTEAGYVYPANGLTYTSGQHTIVSIVDSGPNIGCFQNTILTVNTHPTYNQTFDEVICFGDQVIYGGLPYSQEGTYDVPLFTTLYQCDSNITLNLTVLDPLSVVNLLPPFTEITCSNTSVQIDGSNSFPAQ